ncbi:hypothetical protein BC828DRAFT_384359 [Blastocladiella britannica]|nr:hypothetical protein BC828DRAFT_384359 [Blastocladiella britannica]
MIASKVLAILALVALSSTVEATPVGAPACVVNEAKITAGMGAPQGDRNFAVTPSSQTYTPGQKLSFTVSSSTAATKTFKGLLLYVQPKSDPKKRVGTFEIPTGFKSNVDKCAAITVTADKDSVITHASPADKTIGSKYTWTAPAADQGDLEVFAVVAGTGQKNWQIIKSFTIKSSKYTEKPAAGGYNGADKTKPDTGYGKTKPETGYGKKVCKRWRTKTMAYPASDAAQPTSAGGYSYGGAAPAPAASSVAYDSAAPASTPAAGGYDAAAPTYEAGKQGAAGAPSDSYGGSSGDASASSAAPAAAPTDAGSVGQASGASNVKVSAVFGAAIVAAAAFM